MNSTQDLTGQTVGLWLVLRPHKKPEARSLYYWCRCTGCDGEKPVLAYDLKAGRSTGCLACSKRQKPQIATYNKVIAAIEAAKKEAIAKDDRMPWMKTILEEAGANPTYFCNRNQYARKARNAYSAAVKAIESHEQHKSNTRATQAIGLQIVPDPTPIEAEMESSKPSKEAQLLAHLRWQRLPIKRISRLLDIPEGSVRPMVDCLVREGKIAIKPEPFAKDNKEDAIVLVQQQRRVG